MFGKPTFMTALGLFVCLRAGAKNKIAEEIRYRSRFLGGSASRWLLNRDKHI